MESMEQMEPCSAHPTRSLQPGCSAMGQGSGWFLLGWYLRKENAGDGGRATICGAHGPHGTQGKRLDKWEQHCGDSVPERGLWRGVV